RLRCRIGFHKWIRVRETDPEAANPSQSAEWRTVCRDCKTEHGSGMWFSTLLFGTVLAGGIVGLWYFPLVGAILIVGSVGAMGVVVVPAAVQRIARWLSS